MKSIKELVKTLTLEEEEHHEELIEECKQREQAFNYINNNLRKDLEKLYDISQKMLNDLEKLYEISELLKDASKGINEGNDEVNPLELIPDEHFFHA